MSCFTWCVVHRKLFDSGAPISAAKKVCAHHQQGDALFTDMNAVSNLHSFLHQGNIFSSDLAANDSSLLKEVSLVPYGYFMRFNFSLLCYI